MGETMTQYNLSHWSILQGYPRVFLRYRNTADRIAAAGMDPNQAEKQSWRDIVQLCRRVGASSTSYGNIGRKNTTRIVCRSCCREIVTSVPAGRCCAASRIRMESD
jgi:hypothetical protein